MPFSSILNETTEAPWGLLSRKYNAPLDTLGLGYAWVNEAAKARMLMNFIV